jgi:NAD(P)H-nitrite reductase large subunit
MREDKIIICRCEDVTLKEVYEAFNAGFTNLESIRRYLKAGTGPCQGKTCIPLLQKIIANLKNTKEIENITSRPPESPVPFGALVKRSKDGKI